VAALVPRCWRIHSEKPDRQQHRILNRLRPQRGRTEHLRISQIRQKYPGTVEYISPVGMGELASAST